MSKRDGQRHVDGRGREASRPMQLGRSGWKDVAKRVKREFKRDNLTMVAGGVAFYAFLAIFPALAGLVSLYGLFSDPQQVEQQVSAISGALPGGARDIVQQQMRRVAGGSQGALGWGVAISLLLTIWSANKGTRGLVDALNIVYDEKDERGFIKKNAVTLALTFGGMVTVLLVIGLIVVVPPVLSGMGLGGAGQVAVRLLRWPLLAALVLAGLAVLYHFGPDRDRPQWRWVTPGALAALFLWLLASIAFSIYTANFASYNETYGSLGAVVVLLMWMYLSALAVLIGGELNAEAERQTQRDTTRGPEQPRGQRGARAADTLGGAEHS